MKPKNVMLLGFVNKAADYLNKHLGEDLGTSLTELKNIDLEKLKKELEEELKGKLDPLASPIQTLMDAGGEVFDKFITTEKKDDNLLNDFDRIFDVDLDDEKPVEKKDEIQDLLSYYDLAGEFDIDEDALDEDEKDDKALSYDEVIPEEEEKPIPDEVLAEKSIFEATDNEDELPYELNEEEKKMLETISQNVNRKPEKRSEASLSGANKELDTIFSELVEAEDDKEDVKKEEIEEVKQPTINRIQELSLAEIPEEERKKFIENPLVDVSIAMKKQEEEKETEPEPEPVYPEQVDKDDIIKLMKDIQPMSDVYYNKIENFIDQQEKQKSEPVEAKKEEVREEKKEDSYISSLIDDLKNKMDKEEDLKKQQEEEFKEVYDKIHAAYPYLSNGFIRSVYDLKETIAREYPLNEKIIILHRTSFNNVENLRQYVEITLKHGYMINADEKKMIVDAFRQHINTDGKIITSIFEVANQSALLSGEYEGYRVLFEDDL